MWQSELGLKDRDVTVRFRGGPGRGTNQLQLAKRTGRWPTIASLGLVSYCGGVLEAPGEFDNFESGESDKSA